MSFFNELKRRNVFRVGAAYLVVAWLLLQVMDTVGPIIGLSDSFARGVLFLLAVGFPVVLVISWVFELTPEGIQTQQAADQSGMRSSKGKLNAVIIGGLALALVLVVLDSYVLDEPATESVASIEEADIFDGEITQTTADEKSIAVLPFANLSSDPEQEYFADGLSEELLNKLAQIRDLQVAGRTSSFYYKDTNEDLRVIGETLGVAHILEGSVRKSGNNIRITAQLIKADDGFHLWSDTFDRELTEIFAIQDEIAEAVTTALSISLGVGEFDRTGMTRNVEAYDAYLQGWAVFREEGFIPLRAAEYFKQATTVDPDFGLGWLALSNVYGFARVEQTASEGGDLAELQTQALQQARRSAPEMSELLTTSAGELRANHEWAGAEDLYMQLIDEFGTSMSQVNTSYGSFLRHAGRLQDSIPYLERARRLDPLNPDISMRLSTAYMSLGRLNDALTEAERGTAMGVVAFTVFLTGNKIYIALLENDWNLALELMSGEAVWVTAYGPNLPNGLDVARDIAQGNVDEGLNKMRAMLDSGLSPVFNTAIAPLAVIGGDVELALQFNSNEANPNTNDRFGSTAIWSDFYAGMRQLEGFREMAREAGLADYWLSTGNWPDKCRPLEGNDDFECF